MQVHGPSDVIDAEKISSRLNGHFAVMYVGHVSLYLYTPEECDALIAAATEAKRLLAGESETETPAAAFCPDAYAAPGVEYYCTLKAGHKGLHAQLTSTGAFVAEWGYEDGHVHTTSGHEPASVTA